MAKLYFSYSAMNAGKSTLLLQASYNYRERGMHTLLFIAALDDRSGKGKIGSRIGLESEAIPFLMQDDLFEMIRLEHAKTPAACIFVDEAQFMSEDQVWQLARAVDELDIPAMTFGLRTDFQGELFPGSRVLLAISDTLREIRTICECGRKATMTVRLGADGKPLHEGSQVEIGGNEKYVSLCRRHWKEAMGHS